MVSLAPRLERNELAELQAAYRAQPVRYLPEESPFETVIVDITHRCNMACHNCYIPNRSLPDLPAEAILDPLQRLRRRTRVRLVGAEPTVREDLPRLIRAVRDLGHIPQVLSNGLKLARPSYVSSLKSAGLRTVYLSLNGGLRDDLYLQVDGLACAQRKLKALDVLASRSMFVAVGMILVRGVNDCHLPDFMDFLIRRREVRDIHLRSVGPIGRHMAAAPFDLDELEVMARCAVGAASASLRRVHDGASSRDFMLGRRRIQLTQWPDLGSSERGRLTPDGFIEPFFESVIGNAGGY